MRKGPSTLYGRRYTAAQIIAGSVLTAVLSISFVFPQRIFANHSDSSHQMIANDLPQDQSLVADESEAIGAEKDHSDFWQVIRMRVTAYCPCSKCCGQYADGVTANNHRIEEGDRFVAADKSYPFGTQMIIPGYNVSEPVEVKDRGGAIKNDKLDVFFNTHTEALEWGVQYLDVLVKIQ